MEAASNPSRRARNHTPNPTPPARTDAESIHFFPNTFLHSETPKEAQHVNTYHYPVQQGPLHSAGCPLQCLWNRFAQMRTTSDRNRNSAGCPLQCLSNRSASTGTISSGSIRGSVRCHHSVGISLYSAYTGTTEGPQLLHLVSHLLSYRQYRETTTAVLLKNDRET